MFAPGGPTFFELMRQAFSSTRRGYDLLAPKFDVTPFRTPDELLRFAVKEIGEADAALDVCCGTGAAMKFLRSICRRRMAGLDFSCGMLEQAKAKFEQDGSDPKVEFFQGDVMEMAFQEEFDLATCFGGLGHIVPGQEVRFLRLIHRALKPGGRFVFYTACRPPPLSARNILLCGFNAAMRLRNALWKPPFIMYYFNFLLPGVVEDLERLGFRVEVRSGPRGRFRLVIATRSWRRDVNDYPSPGG